MKTPILKEIPGFPFYFASSDGTIWTCRRKGGNDIGSNRLGKPRELKAHLSGAGYVTVSLVVNGRQKAMRVHRLVLLAFTGPAPDGYHGCHYPDPDKANNRPENLRWDTPSENAKDRYRDKPDVAAKACKTCLEVKSLECFYLDKRARDGRKSQCKKCHISTSLATRDNHKKRQSNSEFMRRKREADPGYGR